MTSLSYSGRSSRFPPELRSLGDYVDVPTASRIDYGDEGHVVVRGLADQSVVDTLRPEVERLVQEIAWDRRPIAERDTYGKAFLQAPNLWRHSKLIAAFTLAPRFAKIAADLMGVERVRLYHDQALLKEGLGGRTPWHQDITTGRSTQIEQSRCGCHSLISRPTWGR